MKTAALENPTLTPRRGFVSDLAELVKARLTLLVLLTTAVGFYLGSESRIDYRALFHTVFGTAAAAGGAAALNQWWERRADALMHRTKSRPLPAGRVCGCALAQVTITAHSRPPARACFSRFCFWFSPVCRRLLEW